jgi:hypothetical protein
LAKRISEKEKIMMIRSFTEGKTPDELAKELDYSKLTIIRNLKKNLGEEKYKEIILQSKQNKVIKNKDIKTIYNSNDFSKEDFKNLENKNKSSEFDAFYQFTEITPLNTEIENLVQKDLSSIPIAEVDFPKVVYMIVDKKIELETKYLKEYPDWQFLAEEELDRKTIEIFFDIKLAKRICNKEQKVIKVPNTKVFKIVAPILLNRGISRIVSVDQLIALEKI